MKLNPVGIIGFNRPIHLQNLLESLSKNKEIKDTKVYFFIDGFNKESDKDSNSDVLKVCNQKWGFKESEIIVNNENIGLKKQIIKSGNFLANRYESFILLEDDLIVGEYFLDYMNKSLDIYKDHENIFHINGYNFKNKFLNGRGTYISKFIHPWGWGTWSHKWLDFTSDIDFDKNKIKYRKPEDQYRFNFFNLATYKIQLDKNEKKLISTWAVYWYQYIFLKSGYSVIPGKSQTVNEGFDGTGTNSGKNSNHYTKLNQRKISNFSMKDTNKNLALISNLQWHIKLKIKDYFKYHLVNKYKD